VGMRECVFGIYSPAMRFRRPLAVPSSTFLSLIILLVPMAHGATFTFPISASALPASNAGVLYYDDLAPVGRNVLQGSFHGSAEIFDFNGGKHTVLMRAGGGHLVSIVPDVPSLTASAQILYSSYFPGFYELEAQARIGDVYFDGASFGLPEDPCTLGNPCTFNLAMALHGSGTGTTLNYGAAYIGVSLLECTPGINPVCNGEPLSQFFASGYLSDQMIYPQLNFTLRNPGKWYALNYTLGAIAALKGPYEAPRAEFGRTLDIQGLWVETSTGKKAHVFNPGGVDVTAALEAASSVPEPSSAGLVLLSASALVIASYARNRMMRRCS
jgi:hypothetical protein